MKTLITGCRIITPGLDVPEGNLLISGNTIEGVDRGPIPIVDGKRIDGRNLIAVPGFIDIHSHGRSGYDFCDGSDEAFATIGRDKLRDGVTSFLATTLSVSTAELEMICDAAERYRRHNHDGATLLGIHLEGPFFNPECAGAQNPVNLRLPDIGLVDELNARCRVKKVSFSPELTGGLEFTRALKMRDIMPSGGHSAADFACFEANRKAGMKHLTHFCNVMTPIHHLRFGMTGGGLLADDVLVEMICDGVHLCDEMIKLISRVKPRSGMMLITDAMRASGMPDGRYSLGGLPVIVKNRRAELTTGQVAGSTLRFCDGFRHFLDVTGLPPAEAISCTALNQAESLHLGRRGRLEPGYIADIALLDSDFNPVTTICGGVVKWRI